VDGGKRAVALRGNTLGRHTQLGRWAYKNKLIL